MRRQRRSEVPLECLDNYLGRIQAMATRQEWYDSYNTAIRVTRIAPPGVFPE